MLPSPRPSDLTIAINLETGDVERHRNLYCPWYDDCLDHAVRQRWKSWTCVRCAIFIVRYGPERLAS